MFHGQRNKIIIQWLSLRSCWKAQPWLSLFQVAFNGESQEVVSESFVWVNAADSYFDLRKPGIAQIPNEHHLNFDS